MFRLGEPEPPAWFVDTFHEVDPSQPVTLLQAFPILDAFLSEAEIFWERRIDGHLSSEPIVVTEAGGETCR